MRKMITRPIYPTSEGEHGDFSPDFRTAALGGEENLPGNQVMGEIGDRHDQFRDDADIKQDQEDDESEPFKFMEEHRAFGG